MCTNVHWVYAQMYVYVYACVMGASQGMWSMRASGRRYNNVYHIQQNSTEQNRTTDVGMVKLYPKCVLTAALLTGLLHWRKCWLELYVGCNVKEGPSLFAKFFHQLFFHATTSVFGGTLHHPYIMLVFAEIMFSTLVSLVFWHASSAYSLVQMKLQWRCTGMCSAEFSEKHVHMRECMPAWECIAPLIKTLAATVQQEGDLTMYWSGTSATQCKPPTTLAI